jgi:hypothetical protein
LLNEDVWECLTKKDIAIPSAFVAGGVFCNIIRYCYLHFVAGDPSILQCRVRHTPKGYTVLRYRDGEYKPGPEKFFHTVRVQLYSTGE